MYGFVCLSVCQSVTVQYSPDHHFDCIPHPVHTTMMLVVHRLPGEAAGEAFWENAAVLRATRVTYLFTG